MTESTLTNFHLFIFILCAIFYSNTDIIRFALHINTDIIPVRRSNVLNRPTEHNWWSWSRQTARFLQRGRGVHRESITL
jgi:hypothetical protein